MANNNKINNPKTEVPTGVALNDKDYITSLLTCLKEMERNYAIVMSEASNESLYDEYRNIFLKIADLQRQVYELMFRKGWYSLEKAPKQKITEKEKMLSTEYQDLELGN